MAHWKNRRSALERPASTMKFVSGRVSISFHRVLIVKRTHHKVHSTRAAVKDDLNNTRGTCLVT